MVVGMDKDPENQAPQGETGSEPVVVPWRELDPATLTALIESFVLREGTDYGAMESQFASKIEQVRRQLEAGTVLIAFDPVEDSVTLLTQNELRRRSSPASNRKSH